MHHVDAVLYGERDDLLEKGKLDALRGGVGRKIDDEHLRLRKAHLDGVLELGEKIDVRRQRHLTDVGAGDHRSVDMDRIAGIGYQHRVTTAESGQREMRDTLLGADGDNRFGFRIELDTVTALIPLADRSAQARYPARHRVAVGVAPLHGLDQLGDDVRRRRPIGVAHAEVDDVLATPARRHLELGGDVEDVWRQALDTREQDWIG